MLRLTKVRYTGLALSLALTGSVLLTKDIKNETAVRDEKMKRITVAELSKHGSVDDCWVGINGKVYDVTDFIKLHPGGMDKIMRYAGNDASRGFKMQHPIEYVEKFIADQYIGKLERIKRAKKAKEVKKERAGEVVVVEQQEEEEKETANVEFKAPPLGNLFCMDDFKYVHQRIYGWKDGIGLNKMALCRIFFRPRCLVDVSDVDMGITLWGKKTALPFVTSLQDMDNVKVVSLEELKGGVKKVGGMKVVLSDVQSIAELEDLNKLGVDGVILKESEGIVSPVEMLNSLKKPAPVAIFVEEGVSRGSDIVKILCLGGVPLVEKTVGVSSIYGEEGINKCIGILQKEVETTMKLIGAKSVDELDRTFLDVSSLEECFIVDYKRYKEENERYTPLIFPKFGNGVKTV